MCNKVDMVLCMHCWSSPETQAPNLKYMVVTFTTDSQQLLSGLWFALADQCNNSATAYKGKLAFSAICPPDCAVASALHSSSDHIDDSFGHEQQRCV